MMRSKVVFVVLFMLSFTVLHDSFIALVEKNVHANTVHCSGDVAPSSDCKEFDTMHGMLHFVAIVTSFRSMQIEFAKKEYIPHFLTRYTPPPVKTSNKPPIA
ncbi:MAG TPA: hypothetical protein VIM88_00090 [Sulfurovum sp.]|uniref:hypothetical protein n=1 Tax=Sulfurovum sp. TaxID=1969726 RepID=UPI002F936FC1